MKQIFMWLKMQEWIKLIKGDSKDFYVRKYLYFK